MNNKQKILTLLALAVFILIIANELFGDPEAYGNQGDWHPLWASVRFTKAASYHPMYQMVMPQGFELAPAGAALLTLAVVYAGLFFVLADKRSKDS